MIPLLISAAWADCVVDELRTEIDLSDARRATRSDTWTLYVDSGQADCKELAIPDSPDGTHGRVVDLRVRIKATDDSVRRVRWDRERDGWRFVRTPEGLDHGAGWAVSLPELVAGDTVTVEVTRAVRADDAALRWSPGARGPVGEASLQVRGAARVQAQHDLAPVRATSSCKGKACTWTLSRVPDGRPEPGGRSWAGSQWVIGPRGSWSELAVGWCETLPEPTSLTMQPNLAMHRVPLSPPAPVSEVVERGWATPIELALVLEAVLRGQGEDAEVALGLAPDDAGLEEPAPAWERAAVIVHGPGGDEVAWGSGPLGPLVVGVRSGVVVPVALSTERDLVTLTGSVVGGRLLWVGEGPTVPEGAVALSGLLTGLYGELPGPGRRSAWWAGEPWQRTGVVEIARDGSAGEGTTAHGQGGGLGWELACRDEPGRLFCAVDVASSGGWLSPAELEERRAAGAALDAALAQVEVLP